MKKYFFALSLLTLLSQSCEEKKFLKNKFKIKCTSVKLLDLKGIDSNECLVFKKVDRLSDLDSDTVFISLFFKKKFVSDSTKKEPRVSYPFEGKEGLYRKLNRIELYCEDSPNESRELINPKLIESNIRHLSFKNTFLKKRLYNVVEGECIKTEAFKSLEELKDELNENTRRVTGENLNHEIIFPILVKDLRCERLKCDIVYCPTARARLQRHMAAFFRKTGRNFVTR